MAVFLNPTPAHVQISNALEDAEKISSRHYEPCKKMAQEIEKAVKVWEVTVPLILEGHDVKEDFARLCKEYCRYRPAVDICGMLINSYSEVLNKLPMRVDLHHETLSFAQIVTGAPLIQDCTRALKALDEYPKKNGEMQNLRGQIVANMQTLRVFAEPLAHRLATYPIPFTEKETPNFDNALRQFLWNAMDE